MLIARAISVIFHPLLLATYMFLLFYFTLPIAFDPIKEDGVLNFIFLIFCVTFLLPVLNIGIFKTFGTIRSVSMVDRRERLLPFVLISILYCLVTYLFYSKTPVSLNDNFLKFMLIIDGLVIVSTLITFFYKVSVHSLAIWGLIGILLPLNKVTDTHTLFYPTLAAIVLAGIIMSARLRLHVHTLREILLGSMAGFATSFFGMYLLF